MNDFNLLKITELLLSFLIIFSLIFIYFNLPALNARLFYNENENFIFEKEQKNDTDFKEQKKAEEFFEKEDRLIIKKIGVSAPIVSISSRQNEILQEGLKNGVVFFPETAPPGEKGNCVIVGHSSNFPWRKGNYDTVFVLLDKLKKGDEIEIFWKGKKFKYIVFKKPQIIRSNQSEILNSSEEPILTLMTCWPIGTNYKRLIVRGKLVK